MTNTSDPLRAEKMMQLFRDGVTLEDIGQRYGMTREGVRQILKKFGSEYTEAQKLSKERRRAALDDATLQAFDAVRAQFPSISRDNVIRAVGASSRIRAQINIHRPRGERQVGPNPRQRGASSYQYIETDVILRWLRQAAVHVGGPLSIVAYGGFHAAFPDSPSLATVVSRFDGKWTAACAAAGVAPAAQARKNYPRVSEETIIDAVTRYMSETERENWGTVSYTRWASGGRAPSSTTIAHRMGGVRAVMVLVLARQADDTTQGKDSE